MRRLGYRFIAYVYHLFGKKTPLEKQYEAWYEAWLVKAIAEQAKYHVHHVILQAKSNEDERQTIH